MSKSPPLEPEHVTLGHQDANTEPQHHTLPLHSRNLSPDLRKPNHSCILIGKEESFPPRDSETERSLDV